MWERGREKPVEKRRLPLKLFTLLTLPCVGGRTASKKQLRPRETQQPENEIKHDDGKEKIPFKHLQNPTGGI